MTLLKIHHQENRWSEIEAKLSFFTNLHERVTF